MTSHLRPAPRHAARRGRFPAPMLAWFCLLFSHGWAQSAFNPHSHLGGLQFRLPWDGPGSALFNPSRLAEAKRGDAWIAHSRYTAEGDAKPFFQGAAKIHGLALGLSAMGETRITYGRNAVIQTGSLVPMAAYAWEDIAGSGYSLGLGASLPMRTFDAFNVIETRLTSWDVGLELRLPPFPGLSESIHSGIAVQNLGSAEVEMPIDMGETFDAQPLSVTASVFLNSLAGFADLYADMKFLSRNDGGREGPDGGNDFVASWGAEARPIPLLGLKVERTWLREWSAGIVLRKNVAGTVDLGLEFNLAQDAFADPGDRGPGNLWALTLNVGV